MEAFYTNIHNYFVEILRLFFNFLLLLVMEFSKSFYDEQDVSCFSANDC